VDITNDDDVQVMRYFYMKPTVKVLLNRRAHAIMQVLMGNEWRKGSQSTVNKQ